MELVDANVVLRYILWDNEESSKKAEEILEKELVVIPFEVIAEVVYVLEKVYGIGRKKIMQFLMDIFKYPNIQTDDHKGNRRWQVFFSSPVLIYSFYLL